MKRCITEVVWVGLDMGNGRSEVLKLGNGFSFDSSLFRARGNSLRDESDEPQKYISADLGVEKNASLLIPSRQKRPCKVLQIVFPNL